MSGKNCRPLKSREHDCATSLRGSLSSPPGPDSQSRPVSSRSVEQGSSTPAHVGTRCRASRTVRASEVLTGLAGVPLMVVLPAPGGAAVALRTVDPCACRMVLPRQAPKGREASPSPPTSPPSSGPEKVPPKRFQWLVVWKVQQSPVQRASVSTFQALPAAGGGGLPP